MLPTNHSQAKLFDKKFVALTLRDARHCDKCKHEYDIKYKFSATDNKPHSSRPVLLNCGHNICENCIYQNRHKLTCAVCHIPIELEHSRWLKKSYDLNYCLLGQIMNAKSFLSSESTPSNYITGGMFAQESFIQKCSECEQAAAIGLCMHCRVDFCKRCFTSVHQNSKVLKKHKLSEFEMQTLQLQLPKEKYCKLHKRLCDKYCSDCQSVLCTQCVRITHNLHHVIPLTVENANHKDKIISFLETMKQTRENIRKAQKDAHLCEKRLEEFATSVTIEISEYFLELHNHLQLEERRILDDLKKSARSPQKAIHEAFAKLSDFQTTLNNMRSSLEGYIHKPPHEFHINALLEVATVQLEQLPCQIQISEIEKNPFTFKQIKDVRKDISNSYEVFAIDPKLSIRITPMYGDVANTFEISSDRYSPEPASMMRTDCMVYQPSTMSTSSTSTHAVVRTKRIGHVSNIISPWEFYVQNGEAIAEICSQLADVDGNSGMVEAVNIGEMYLVYHVPDETWFRGIAKEEVKQKNQAKDEENLKFKVYLLDYGIHEEIPRKWFREIQGKIRAMPAGAATCRLLDVGPVDGEEWAPEARELMEEIIQNKPVQVIIQDTLKSPWNVEVSTLTSGEQISLRDALIYTGLGIDTSVAASQRYQKFTGTKPTQLSKMKNRLSRPMIHPGEFFRVKITNVENPQLFFAVKFAQLEELINLEAEMDLEYSGEPSDTIYYAQLQMCCALFVENKWYRGCIEEINGPSSIRVRLVDDGRSVTVGWRQLRVLKDRFTQARELSIECSLADVQPLQENDYEWTDAAIGEFTRMVSNPNIQMTISSSSQFRYQVILYALKKHLDINIGAMLVKFKHAVTTGDGSAVVENLRATKSPLDQLVANDEIKEAPAKVADTTLTIRTLKRTPVQLIHINNPGEFYIHLVEHIPGILKFHEELQLAQEQREPNEDDDHVDWKINDHCMVLASINEMASDQWYRGIIIDIDSDDPDNPYAVFLRDRGLIIRDIGKSQMKPIDDLFDRICNAAILCHLACVHPTGGMKTWSHSSIDEFTHNVSTFESLGATIQGTTKNNSIPVVLWGMITETNDPLAPCTTKFTNINKLLVCAGLAHLAEKIDITLQMDKFIQDELEHGQQTLQDWYDNFKKTLAELPVCLDRSGVSEEDISVASIEHIAKSIRINEVVTEWLPAEPIEKTIFTGYPTYVDEEAIVYLHDADKHGLLNRMRMKINEEVEVKPLNERIEEVWSVGQPCLARYHLDNSLYRAVIDKALANKKYKVHFIDYGNTEVCDVKDLHRMTAFPNIPIQAVRYRIDGIKPRGDQENFTTVVLDLIHGCIVDKLCGIRVPMGEENKIIKKCSIRFDSNDLATYLIKNGFVSSVGNRLRTKEIVAMKTLQSCPVSQPEPVIENEAINSDDELREFMKYKICDPTGNPVGCSPTTTAANKENLAMFNPEEYRQMFEKMQNDKLYKSVTDADSENSQLPADCASNDDDEDIVELEFSFRSNYWHVDNNTESVPPPHVPKSEVGSNFENFDPLDSSSLLSNFSGIEAFKAPQLPSSVKSFYCDVAYARSSTILHIFPHLSELEYRQIELARRIQVMVRKIPPLTKFEVKTPCLARYSKDKLWYRAIIRSHNATSQQVKVFYVDFLNTEVLAEEYVRKCPKDLLTWPLRTFEMKLFGLKPNSRLREKDVKQAIKKCLNDRTLYAKILRERGKIPEICLFKSKEEKEVPVYEDLIIKNYFCRE